VNWLQKHISTICMAFGLFAAVFVLVSWGIGYYANALFGMHFDLGSCWQGVGAIGAGLVGLFKWLVDSKFNTGPGMMPGQRRDDVL